MPFAPRISRHTLAISNDLPTLFRLSSETNSGVSLIIRKNESHCYMREYSYSYIKIDFFELPSEANFTLDTHFF